MFCFPPLYFVLYVPAQAILKVLSNENSNIRCELNKVRADSYLCEYFADCVVPRWPAYSKLFNSQNLIKVSIDINPAMNHNSDFNVISDTKINVDVL